jgi:hypothetical protein
MDLDDVDRGNPALLVPTCRTDRAERGDPPAGTP